MIALHAAHGPGLSALDEDEILDLADAVDPDDMCLAREIEQLGAESVEMAKFVGVLVDATYGAPAAFENAITANAREEHTAFALSGVATRLVARVALDLAATNSSAVSTDSATIVDATGTATDLLIGVAAEAGETVDLTAITADSDDDAARLQRRWLLVHGMPRIGLTVGEDGEFAVSGPVVHVAQFPTSSNPDMSPRSVLSAIESIVLQMDDAQRGVVIAPASVLVDARLSVDARELRSDLLRSGHIRAIVRLPAGLLPGSPRRATALWVLGPAHKSVPIADRWTMTADLSDTPLTQVIIDELIVDLAATMADLTAVRAHAFRFARLAPTRTLLARSGTLINPTGTVQHTVVSTETPSAAPAVQLDELLDKLGRQTALGGITIESSLGAHHLPPTPLGTLADSRHLRLLPGTRLHDEDIGNGAGFAVLGIEEISGARRPGTRTIDRFAFSTRYPHARLTEPGDIVFSTGSGQRARVDREGSAVVAYPARILRINSEDSAGLLPDLLAADINAAKQGGDWRKWIARRVLPEQRAPLTSALANIRSEREATLAHLATLDELANLLTSGVSAGTLAIANTETTPDSTPPKERH